MRESARKSGCGGVVVVLELRERLRAELLSRGVSARRVARAYDAWAGALTCERPFVVSRTSFFNLEYICVTMRL